MSQASSSVRHDGSTWLPKIRRRTFTMTSDFIRILLLVLVLGCHSQGGSCDRQSHSTDVDMKQAAEEKSSSLVQASVTTRKDTVSIEEWSDDDRLRDPHGSATVTLPGLDPKSVSDARLLHRAFLGLLALRERMQDVLLRSNGTSSVGQVSLQNNPIRSMFLYAVALLLIFVVFFVAALGLGFIPPAVRSCGGQQAQQRQSFFTRDKTAQHMQQGGRQMPPGPNPSLRLVEAHPHDRSSQAGKRESLGFGPRTLDPAEAAKQQKYGSAPEPPPQSVGGALLTTPPPSGRAPPSARVSVQPPGRSSEAIPGAMPMSPHDKVQDPGGHHHLCPELVVPEGSECTLLVPRLPPRSSSENGQVSVDDARGVPVFRASFVLGDQQRRDNKRLILSSAAGDAVFAFCRDSEADAAGSSTRKGLTLHHHFETPFGVLRPEGRNACGGYVVVTRRGFTVQFRGDMKAGNLNATDEHGRLLGISEQFGPAGSGRRSIRIGPLVDAGLIALALLGIDLLEYEAASSSSSKPGELEAPPVERRANKKERHTQKMC